MRDKRATLMGEGMFMTVFDALPTDAIVTIIIVSVLALAGVGVLLYFSVFSKLSLKRQARDLKNVRDSMDSLAQATSNSVKDLFTDRRYKELKNYLPSAKKTIGEYEEKVEALYKGLKDKFAVEENVSSLSLRC